MSVAEYARLGFGESPETVIDDLTVTGTLPPWLTGTLLRNGPGTFRVGDERYRHWFDGLAMLHRFTIEAGRVSYASRFLEGRTRDEAERSGRIPFSEFATDPCRSMFARTAAVFHREVTDSAKVNITRVADRYLALAETPIQVAFDPVTLKSTGVTEWDESTLGRMTTVHPHLDEARAEGFNLVTRYGAASQYVIRKFDTRDPGIATRTHASRRVAEPAYIHSFGMSTRYLVVAEFPFVVNPLSLLLWIRPYIENFRWKPRRGTRFHVFDRSTGTAVGTYETEAFFAFHHVNAYDHGDDLVVDLVAYDDASIIDSFYVHRLENPESTLPKGHLSRFRLPVAGPARPVTAELLSDTALELPSFDAARKSTATDHRYVYGVGVHDGQGFYDQLVKIDLDDGTALAWHKPHCYPGEGVFAGRPGRRAEDDGVILSVVLDEAEGTSFLLVLDAGTFTEVARVTLPHPVLFGYHGQYYAAP